MDKRLKQRLLGAAVIVALAVIFLPELVKQAPSQDPLAEATEIPPRPAALAALPSGTVSLPSEAASMANDSAAAAEADDDNSMQENEMAQTLPAIVDAVDDIADTADTEQQRRQTEAIKNRDAQQLKEQQERRRSERQRADQAARRLAKIEADDKEAAAREKMAKASAAQAEKNKKPPSLPKLQLISPDLYQQKPTKNTPNRWIVQAGSFADSQNAKLLRERLRTLQFQVSLNQATVDGETRYRVQVGPHVSRAESERIRDRLLREAGIPSSVVPIYN